MTLTLISIGLTDHNDLTQRAIQAAKKADHLYLETYTMPLNTSPTQLQDTIQKPVTPLTRDSIEDNSHTLLQQAQTSHVAILVGGDALSATTHMSLILEARKQGIDTHVIHGSSILTAAAETGLSLYKFGRTVTVPLPEKGPVDTVLRTLKENQEHGLHTLILLDLNIPQSNYLTINQAIQRLTEAELNPDTLLVAIARAGYPDQIIKADRAVILQDYDFGDPPHALVAPGRLHFMEEEALMVLGGCPQEVVSNHKVQGEVERLVDKYSKSCRRVIEEIKLKELPRSITKEDIKKMMEHATNYLNDAEYYRTENLPVALASVSYAEGILDALKLMDLAEFEW